MVDNLQQDSMEITIQKKLKGEEGSLAEVKVLDKTRMESAFVWTKGELDVERLRVEMFEIGYKATDKQNDLMNSIEDNNREVNMKMNEKGQAQETMIKVGIRNTDQRAVWETKMIKAGDRVSELRKEVMKQVVVLCQTLNWELSSGHFHALARDISGSEDGSYGLHLANDPEAQALYDVHAAASDDEFYEVAQREKSDPYYNLRPSAYTTISKEIAVKNSERLQQLLDEKLSILNESATKESELKRQSESTVEGEVDPLDAFMAQNAENLVSTDQAAIQKETAEIRKIQAEYVILLKALDVPLVKSSSGLDGDSAARFERIQKIMADKSNRAASPSLVPASSSVVHEPYSAAGRSATDKLATSNDLGGPMRLAAAASLSSTAQDIIMRISSGKRKEEMSSAAGDDD
eukprot:GHVH01004029.1.p1 GENE.GHVH01004029.1~~GHVH01004029.1.p1  ORF type:complete len:406 (-),score=72.99 GHVH01004029.1:378-1595(-)